MSLAGKNALCTGCISLSGGAILTHLLDCDANVYLDRCGTTEIPAEWYHYRNPKGNRARVVNADTSTEQGILDLMSQVDVMIDILVINASFQPSLLWDGTLDERMDRALNLNVKRSHSMAYLAIPHMVRGSRVIFVTTSPHKDALDSGLLATCKGAVTEMGKNLAAQLHGSGVTVNCVVPNTVEETGADVARAVEYLAGQGGEFITGQIICVGDKQ